MKKTHRGIIIFFTTLTVLGMMLMSACGDSTGETANSTASNAGHTSSAQAAPATGSTNPTETAEATPTAKPTPAGPKNLLSYAIEDDPLLLGGDSWSAVEDAWAGPHMELRGGAEDVAYQEFTDVELSDGKEGTAYHFYSAADTGYHVVGNVFGIFDMLDAGKKYDLTVVLKFTIPNPALGRDDMGVGCSIGDTAPIQVIPGDEWQTVTYTFTAGSDVDSAYIFVGPCGTKGEKVRLGEIQAGFDLLIESVSLIEAE